MFVLRCHYDSFIVVTGAVCCSRQISFCAVSWDFFAVTGGGDGSRKAHPRVRGGDGCSQLMSISSDWKVVVLSRFLLPVVCFTSEIAKVCAGATDPKHFSFSS